MLNYVLARRCSYRDTPVLWATSQQPLTATKDAVDLFLAYLNRHATEDRAALVIYSASDNTAILEQALTNDFAKVAKASRERQAGHYAGGTNISAGMRKGREEIEQNARVGAARLLVVMTDGMVTLPTGNSNTDKQLVRDEAQRCADARIPIATISVGVYADTALMQEVADIAGGVAFVVPGGQPINDVRDQLEEAFAEVAADRPLKLVQ
jgi:hypothetical protein